MSTSTNKDHLFASLKPTESIRGETPPDIAQRCLQLCQDYIGGVWKTIQSEEQFTVKRITGGLTNQLYRVKLNEDQDASETACTDVAIKLYQSKNVKNYHPEDEERFNDTIICTIMSEIGIGPKVFGLFKDGMVMEYYEIEEFAPKHQQHPTLLKQLINSLARVHHLRVPIRKLPEIKLDLIESYFTTAYEKLNVQEVINELSLSTLQKNDPRIEFAQVRKLIRQLQCPVVFCHNDFRGSNILVHSLPNGKEQIILTDFESSNYGYRPADITNYIVSWGYEAFNVAQHKMPDDEVIRQFIRHYIESCEALVPGYSKQPENGVEVILKEVKVYQLVNQMFIIGFMMQLTYSFIASMPFDQKAFLKFCEDTYAKYFEWKQHLLDEGIIQ